jgi:RNA polymerase sigma factor (sigma-70 family)
MILNDDDWSRIIAGLGSGDPEAARLFCDRFGPALMRLADRRLPDAIRRRVGPEDVVQSACRTFLRRAKGGEFRLPDSESLWQLLCAITLTKVREQARFHLRQKRDVGQEVGGLGASGDESTVTREPAAGGQDPGEAVAFADQFERLLGSLDPEERQLVDLKLQEYTNDQVAERMGCSSRTVTRLLKRVQARLSRAFADSVA